MSKKKDKEVMNMYLRSAFRKLNSNDLKELLFWLLDKKQKCYDGIQVDVDMHNNLIFLNELEEKLGNIYVNLIQMEESSQNETSGKKK